MRWLLAVMVVLALLGASSAQQSDAPQTEEFPLDRSKTWMLTFPDARGTMDQYRLRFLDRPVNVFPDLLGTQAIAERGTVSRYVTSVLYLRQQEVLLLSLFVRMPLLVYEPAINCALRRTETGWMGVGKLERVSEFIRKLRDEQLTDTSPCELVQVEP